MPEGISIAPVDVRLWVALDVHKFSIAPAVLPPAGAGRRSRGLRGPRRRSAGLSSVWEPLRGWRSAMRQAQAGWRCGGC